MKSKIGLALAIASTSAFAGTMGPVVTSEKFFLIEGGLAYTHAFYKDSAVFAESFTPVTPAGFAINPNNFYPKNFWGGYMGLSFYFPSWLLNARYSLYESKEETNYTAGTVIELQPAKLAFTADKVWGNINQLSYGLGAGAIVETLNKGEARIHIAADNPVSETFQGRTQINPLVEGFVMYRFANNFGAKFNLEYQIPVSRTFGDGDLNLSLGINYALPV
ncbi:hypothetical protein [Legionella erythra]|uniref:Outer membrane protein beta-barrel domain-containing protein n=1 Tax=Legionella erythra TaxID=448 RepID=A0A0W0TKM8_LEGER|nr:hypothetical protein [Legionella erythra]KTC96131.1 hypothetical protein Lery_1923 [Legionella erythra]